MCFPACLIGGVHRVARRASLAPLPPVNRTPDCGPSLAVFAGPWNGECSLSFAPAPQQNKPLFSRNKFHVSIMTHSMILLSGGSRGENPDMAPPIEFFCRVFPLQRRIYFVKVKYIQIRSPLEPNGNIACSRTCN